MKKSWTHLPNATLIDRIISSVKGCPLNWIAARRARDEAYNAAFNAAFNAPAWGAVMGAVMDAAFNAAFNAAAWGAVRDAILALIVYPDSARFLDMTPDELRVWIALSEDPCAILLLPAVIAFSKEKEIA
jgi:hypothetical protein